MTNTSEIFSSIKKASEGLHKAGSFTGHTLDAIARHAGKRTILNSVETGSGASTLLFSHLSKNHTVFAMDDGNGSIRNVQSNPLLRGESVTFVEGPSQKTIPEFQFTAPLQMALIDGPHGYPFPDLEYYYFYPHLDRGALLIVDDIHIPTIRNLFKFLSADKMFHLDEVVGATAFFTRTDAPVFDPYGDGWWEQEYNLKVPARYLLRSMARRILPEGLLKLLRS